jgi:hypothetical protein
MFRKIALGLIAAASLGAAALAPAPASAHGIHGFGWGWNGGWGHHGFYRGSPVFVGGLTDDCFQQRVVETRRGPRVRTVNVCAY